MDLLDLLLDHDYWATVQLLDARGGLSDAQLNQPFDIGHQTVRESFGHMIFNVPFWASFLTTQPADDRYSADNQLEDRSLAALRSFHQRTYADFASVARQMRDELRMDEVFVDHYEVRKSFGGTILMVILHNAEHRTEILHILQRLGVPDLPEVDLGLWDYLLQNT